MKNLCVIQQKLQEKHTLSFYKKITINATVMPNDEMNTQTSNIFQKTTDVSNFSDVLFPQNLNILILNVNCGFSVLRTAQFNQYNDKKKNNPIFLQYFFFFFENKRKNKNIISISKAETVWNYTITLRIRKKNNKLEKSIFSENFLLYFLYIYKIQMF